MRRKRRVFLPPTGGFQVAQRQRRWHEREAIHLAALVAEYLIPSDWTLAEVREIEEAMVTGANRPQTDTRRWRGFDPSHVRRLVDAGLAEDLGSGHYTLTGSAVDVVGEVYTPEPEL